MQRRPPKFVWLLLALLLTGQSALPVAALAQATVRCVGAPAPCAQRTFVAADAATVRRHFAGMACCRTMAGCPPPAMSRHGAGMVMGMVMARDSAPGCLLTVGLLNARPAALGPQAHPWLLGSAPPLAPPPARAASAALVPVDFPTASFGLPSATTAHAHGLRGPPCA